jgi:hypothetical protein
MIDNMIYKILILSGLNVLLIFSCNNEKKQVNVHLVPKTIVQSDNLSITNQDNGKDYSKIGSEIMQKENIGGLKYGLSLTKMIEILGEPDAKTESELWGSDNEYHQTYKYSKKGIKLDIIGDKEAEKKINMITIFEPCDYKTLRNIGIGSNYEEVDNAYMDQIDPKSSDPKSIVVGSIYGGLIFHIKDKKVESMFIGAAAE